VPETVAVGYQPGGSGMEQDELRLMQIGRVKDLQATSASHVSLRRIGPLNQSMRMIRNGDLTMYY